MKVVHLSTDDVTGGAARCAYRLHDGLERLGVDSRMLVSRRRSADEKVEVFTPDRSMSRRLHRAMRSRKLAREVDAYSATRPAHVEAFHGPETRFDGDVLNAAGVADVYNLHWVSRFVDVPSFLEKVAGRTPVVWTLHDMNLITGGCHYDDGCGRYTDRCGACPQLGSGRDDDLSRRIWRTKHDMFAAMDAGDLHIVTPSSWLADRVRQSSVTGYRFPVSVIPYGLDLDAFAPRDRQECRRILGIPADAEVLLFAAHSVGNRRKGFGLLVDALDRIRDRERLFVLSVGRGAPDLAEGIAGRHVGYTGEDRLLGVLYSAADLFVLPSLQDNLPATMLESIACGTPVVAFDAGGIREAVKSGRTGEVVPTGDPGALAAAIAGLLDRPAHLEELRRSCRDTALAEYTLDLQARRYRDLYSTLR